MRRVSRRSLALLSVAGAAMLGGVLALTWPRQEPADPPRNPPVDTPSLVKPAFTVSQVVFDGKFENGWAYWGLGAHELPPALPARVSFESYGGLIVHRDQPQPQPHFGALGFRFRPPASFPRFLKVSLKSTAPTAKPLPVIALEAEHVTELQDGWRQVWVSFRELNPTGAAFNRIQIEASQPVPREWVEVDKIVLAEPMIGISPQPSARKVPLRVSCRKPGRPISPLIYGVVAGEVPGRGEAAQRIGGNAMTRLNWDLGNVWNTGSDWFFENVKGDTDVWHWFDTARKRRMKLAMVVPTIGWVAKDATSIGFPVSKLGAQRKSDPKRPDAGDGHRPDGSPLPPLPPSQTSVAAPPELIRRWLEKLRAIDREVGARTVSMYILDNEPSLWNTTHRDVHPEPVGYDELLDRTIRYGSVIREVDPEAVIAGPAEWGWSAYFDSAKDLAGSAVLKPDRRLHGNVPILPWYLQKLAEHERRTGVRLLDVVDVHFYPQAQGVYANAKTDPETAALRLRSTRALWDPSYADESWIKEPIELIPRVQAWIKDNYPGRGLSLGEWSFGGEQHISGGLALAEALGRFGQHGLTAAFHWGKLEPGSPGYLGFVAYRNFDGKGATFQDFSVPAESADGVSLFVSRDASAKRFVAVLINLDPLTPARVALGIGDCGRPASRHVYGFGPGSKTLEDFGARPATPGEAIDEELPPHAVRVIDFTFTTEAGQD